MAKKIEINCPRCDGQKKISGFGHIANGDCFKCHGNGTVMVTESQYEKTNELPELTDYVKVRSEFILNATEEQINGLTYKQSLASRDFVHSYNPHYPGLRDIWFERFNGRFCYLQDERLARFTP